jgi:PIN domain nuclease of toxin-antitoxin system
MMLLDSHVLLFLLVDGGQQIGADARQQISVAPRVFVSIASIWELEIKRGLSKLTLPVADWYSVAERGIEIIGADINDAVRAGSLPLHHRDPFDRMIIAQALNRGLVVATRDRAFESYGVPILWT